MYLFLGTQSWLLLFERSPLSSYGLKGSSTEQTDLYNIALPWRPLKPSNWFTLLMSYWRFYKEAYILYLLSPREYYYLFEDSKAKWLPYKMDNLLPAIRGLHLRIRFISFHTPGSKWQPTLTKNHQPLLLWCHQ